MNKLNPAKRELNLSAQQKEKFISEWGFWRFLVRLCKQSTETLEVSICKEPAPYIRLSAFLCGIGSILPIVGTPLSSELSNVTKLVIVILGGIIAPPLYYYVNGSFFLFPYSASRRERQSGPITKTVYLCHPAWEYLLLYCCLFAFNYPSVFPRNLGI